MKNDATSKYNFFEKSHNNECSLLSRDISHKNTYSKKGQFYNEIYLIRIPFSNSCIYLIRNNETISEEYLFSNNCICLKVKSHILYDYLFQIVTSTLKDIIISLSCHLQYFY